MSREGRAVVDASLVIDFVLGIEGAASIGERIEGLELWAPAHIDAEVLSAFGRMERAGLLSAEQADLRLRAARRASSAVSDFRGVGALVRGITASAPALRATAPRRSACRSASARMVRIRPT